jgi:hypothetical protein
MVPGEVNDRGCRGPIGGILRSMRRRRSVALLPPDEDAEVIDLRQRLAPYSHTRLQPGWRESLIVEDIKRRNRRPRADQWGFRR